jgi:hypothetical protein
MKLVQGRSLLRPVVFCAPYLLNIRRLPRPIYYGKRRNVGAYSSSSSNNNNNKNHRHSHHRIIRQHFFQPPYINDGFIDNSNNIMSSTILTSGRSKRAVSSSSSSSSQCNIPREGILMIISPAKTFDLSLHQKLSKDGLQDAPNGSVALAEAI